MDKTKVFLFTFDKIDIDRYNFQIFIQEFLKNIFIFMNGKDNKSFFNRGSLKLELRHWIGTLIVAIVAGFVIFGLLRGQEFLASFLVSQETKKIQRELERPYREDKYGGKTPEKTFDLFLEALRKENIELASKYFELEKQEKWIEILNQYKSGGLINDYIFELEKRKREWQFVKNNGQEAFYSYLVKVERNTKVRFGDQILDLPTGEYENFIIFIKSLNNLWKIREI